MSRKSSSRSPTPWPWKLMLPTAVILFLSLACRNQGLGHLSFFRMLLWVTQPDLAMHKKGEQAKVIPMLYQFSSPRKSAFTDLFFALVHQQVATSTNESLWLTSTIQSEWMLQLRNQSKYLLTPDAVPRPLSIRLLVLISLTCKICTWSSEVLSRRDITQSSTAITAALHKTYITILPT